MNKKIIVLVVVSAVIVLVDQVTKMAIHSSFSLHESRSIIDGFFNLTYVRNPGAAFGFLQGAAPMFRKVFFLSITPIALGVILYFLKTTKDNDWGQIAALSCVFGGAIGNYIDRIRFGYVIDFLDFYLKGMHYPAFNVADSAIVVGVILLLFFSYQEEKKAKQES
jgi:signal peptidase II